MAKPKTAKGSQADEPRRALATALKATREVEPPMAEPPPYGVIFDKNKAIVGVPHGQSIPMDEGLKQRLTQLGKTHGYWYEGDGGDRQAFEAPYKGSWDDKLARDVKGYPSEFLSAMFSASDLGKQTAMVEDPKRTVFDSLLQHSSELSPLKGRKFSKRELSEYLSRISDDETDFQSLAQQPATRENVAQFFNVGASKTFPENWEQFPHKAGQVMRDFLDRRDKFLLSQDRGVYFVGAGHLRNLQRLNPELKMLGGEKAQ